MIIRDLQKKQQTKKIIRTTIAILAGSILFIKTGSQIYEKIQNFINPKNAQITTGQTFNIDGIIEKENNFPVYTHAIHSTKDGKIFLKSNTINLNEYEGNGEIFGTVVDISKKMPIIEVESIKFKDQGLIIKNNIYFFTKDLLYLDFSTQPDLSAKKTEKEIEVYFKGKKIFSIERFLCSKILNNKSCNYLRQDYDNNQKENFDSYRGYTYYKHGTGLRTIFDGDMFGYIFKNVEEDILLDISSMIRIVDKEFIINNKKQQIKDVCNKLDDKLEYFSFSKTKYKDNNWIGLNIEGRTKRHNEINCDITFDMRNERKIIEAKILE